MTDTPHTRALRTTLVDALVAAGALPDPRWQAAFRAVPRHVFVPTVDGIGDPDAALGAVYSDRTLVTQRIGGVPTSSGTMPSLVASMLHALDVHDGHRVLQVATGTGYTAALLCHRLGSRLVTTIDVDPALTALARVRLACCDLHPAVITRDGARGDPGEDRYDRLLATVGVDHMPTRWLHQVRPGGLIVAPVRTGIARIEVTSSGVGHGWFVDAGYFMPDRMAPPRPLASAAVAPRRPAYDAVVPGGAYFHSDFRFLLDLAVPGLAATFRGAEPDEHAGLTLTAPDGSHAQVTPAGSAVQTGPRQVWHEVEAAHRLWRHLGSPARQRYGLTATPDRQWIWLDHPDGDHVWPLPHS